MGASEIALVTGEDGDYFYVLECGAADVYVPKLGSDPVFAYKPGNSFGELALMYNTPRAATIKVRECPLLFGGRAPAGEGSALAGAKASESQVCV